MDVFMCKNIFKNIPNYSRVRRPQVQSTLRRHFLIAITLTEFPSEKLKLDNVPSL